MGTTYPTRKVCGKIVAGIPMIKVQVSGQFYWYSVEEVARHREGVFPWNKRRQALA